MILTFWCTSLHNLSVKYVIYPLTIDVILSLSIKAKKKLHRCVTKQLLRYVMLKMLCRIESIVCGKTFLGTFLVFMSSERMKEGGSLKLRANKKLKSTIDFKYTIGLTP